MSVVVSESFPNALLGGYQINLSSIVWLVRLVLVRLLSDVSSARLEGAWFHCWANKTYLEDDETVFA